MTTETKTDTRRAQIIAARESFSGKTLTDSQFHEAWAITNILDREIHKTGSFREKLTDYAHAYARSERFDALRGETILRDVFTARFGQSMNQTREGLKAREENLPATARTLALDHAESIARRIKDGPTQPFYQAYDGAALALGRELQITQSGAKTLMKDIYQTHHERDLYEVGKALEATWHKPVREAEIAARKAEKLPTRGQTQSHAQDLS